MPQFQIKGCSNQESSSLVALKQISATCTQYNVHKHSMSFGVATKRLQGKYFKN